MRLARLKEDHERGMADSGHADVSPEPSPDCDICWAMGRIEELERAHKEIEGRIAFYTEQVLNREDGQAVVHIARRSELDSARIAALEEALRHAVSWWEAAQIISSEPPTEQERTALDDTRDLIGLPRLNSG